MAIGVRCGVVRDSSAPRESGRLGGRAEGRSKRPFFCFDPLVVHQFCPQAVLAFTLPRAGVGSCVGLAFQAHGCYYTVCAPSFVFVGHCHGSPGPAVETGNGQVRTAFLVIIKESSALGRFNSFLRCYVDRAATCLDNATNILLPWRLVNAVTSYLGYLQLSLWPRDNGGLLYAPSQPPVLVEGNYVCGDNYLRNSVGNSHTPEIPVAYRGLVLVSRDARTGYWACSGGRRAMADQYAYLPQIGLIVAVTWLPVIHRRLTAAVIATALLPALMSLAWLQTSFWIAGGRLAARLSLHATQ